MLSFTSYDGLKAAVLDWLGRDDLAPRVPDFIALAERRMARELRLRAMEHRAELSVAAGQGRVSLPCRREVGDWDVFLEMRSLVWCGANGQRRALRFLPPSLCAESRGEVGQPQGYGLEGGELVLVPAPAVEGRLELAYWAEVPPLGDAQESNALLLAAPDLYLYAALVESAPYTRGSAPLELWERFYSSAKMRLEQAERRASLGSDLRMAPTRRV